MFPDNVIKIKSLDVPELDIYARKSEVQLLHYFEPHGGVFIAESPKVIERALDAGCEPLSFLMEDKHVLTQGKAFLSRCKDVPVYTAEFEVLTKLTGFGLTRGMLCAMKRPENPSVEAVCEKAKRVAVMESVVNPTNVGAIFRSAAAMGMDAVLLTGGCSDPLYRRAIRVSMGTVFQIPWTFLPETGISKLKELGFRTVAMALCDNSVDIRDERLKQVGKLAVVLGTEGEGLPPETIAQCDYTVKIPMAHGVDSLNVAAASAVAFFELC